MITYELREQHFRSFCYSFRRRYRVEGTNEILLHDRSIHSVILPTTCFDARVIQPLKRSVFREYFSANRSMGVVPLAIALAVSFMSAITLLGISAENYAHGTQVTLLYLGGIIGTPIALYLYLPVFYKLKATSVYEYLEKRFGMKARLVASGANFLQLMMYTGVVLFAPSLALEATTGLSGTTSVLLIGVICTFYSTVGGIKAVLITDVFQGLLMFAGIACVLGIAATDLDEGLSDVWSIAKQGGRLNFFDFRFDPTIRHTWWSLLIGSTTIYVSLYAVNQVQVQRLLTARSFKDSQNALLLSGPVTLSLGLLTSYSGLVLYMIYKDCDPVTSGKISSFDKIMPFFAAERMSRVPGITGLFISGIFSASLSTISATLNALAAMALEDYVKPLCRATGVQFPNEKATLIGKLLGIFNGLVCMAVAFMAKSMGTLVETAIGISGAIIGPILGIFTLGMFVESANETGAVVGTISALITCLWAAFGKPKPEAPFLPLSVDGCENSTALLRYRNATQLNGTETPPEDPSYFYLYRISYMWYSPMGLTITLLVGYLTSLLAKRICQKDTREPDPNLFTPLVASRIKRRREDAEKTRSSQVFVLENRR
ncbi:putative sodium-dependent multivitamin transporter isoform X2 [Osmia bicornis bicornis]|uniref:putative sodium-dependent multivitamin transporter isoform X2 n=1 Tax=Osmia bicornis bicornis TaxID=1437191 RepID=UPI0010F7970A|nr:putative sodium-dependent multivitamin transporter isoform X2 [Osmia bicornis bicornis]